MGVLLGGTKLADPHDPDRHIYHWLICTNDRTIQGEKKPYHGSVEDMFAMATTALAGLQNHESASEEDGADEDVPDDDKHEAEDEKKLGRKAGEHHHS